MKQLLQNMKNGTTEVKEIPIPRPAKGMALVQTAYSLVSAGTEKTLVEFAEKNIFEKAASRPDLVKQVIDKAKREGALTTFESAFHRLDQPMYPGYSSSGTIIALGDDMTGFQVGDRVACGGGKYAVHAEYCTIPRNLLVKIPADVHFEEAAFATLGAVAMHGFRLASPQLNETVLVIGLGLLGLMAIQAALAAGCHVLGLDISQDRVKLAKDLGAEACLRTEIESFSNTFTKNRGFDHVLICAGSKDNDSIELAGQMCRDRGNVIAIGAVGLEIPRKLYYEKEINFRVSRSYGPGRYDTEYEEKGHDYPIGFVRWTEGRNMESFIDLIACGKMNVRKLITHLIPIEEGQRAYELITGKSGESFLGVLLEYQNSFEAYKQDEPVQIAKTSHPLAVTVGVLGAGNYATTTFLPALKKCTKPISLLSIASGSGSSARHAAEKFGFEKVDTSGNAILDDPAINTIVLLTRHHLHGTQVLRAIQNGKNVYCEKPLALTIEELEAIYQAVQRKSDPILTVGYNRRFSPMGKKLFEFFSDCQEPVAMHYTINAGYIPPNHWTQDPAIGGRRIIGECCHFIDVLQFISQSHPTSVYSIALPDNGRYNQDNVSLQIKFTNGSIGTISYLANGEKSYPKERLEVFGAGKIAVLDDFRTLETWDKGNHHRMKSVLRQDKGHAASWQMFINTITDGSDWPIPMEDLFYTTLASFAAVHSIQENDVISIPDLSIFSERGN